MAILCASLGLTVQSTQANFTDNAKATVSLKAEQWIVPSFEAFPEDYRSGTVSWEPAGLHTTYLLQWSTSSTFTNPESATVAGNTYLVSGLTASTNYYFRVRATTAPNTSAWSTTASLTSSTQLPTTSEHVLEVGDPHGLALDSKGNMWVTDHRSGEITRITTTGATTRIGVHEADTKPRGISMINDSTAAFVHSYNGQADHTQAGLYTVTTSGVVTKRYLKAAPYGVAYNPMNKKLYVSFGSELNECSTTTWDCNPVLVQASIGHIGVTPDGSKITIAGSNTNVLSTFDVNTKKHEVLFATKNMDVRGAQAIATNDYLASSWKTGDVWRIRKDETTGAVSVKAVITGAVHPRMMTYYEPTDVVNVAMSKSVGDNPGIYEYQNLLR